MSDCFTDIRLSDTDTASSLCFRKVATDYRQESTRDSRREFAATWFAGFSPRTGSPGNGALPQDLRHRLLDQRQPKWFGQMGIACGAEKTLRRLIDYVAAQKEDPPR